MIATIETGSPAVIGLKLCGKLHDWDYKQFVPRMETILTAQGKVGLFLELDDFHGWDMHAAWDDLKFSLKHYSDFERIAMVGDCTWEKWMASFCKPFTKAKVVYFDRSEVDAAWNWLKESGEDGRSKEAVDRKLDVPDNSDIWDSFRWYGT